ncbi:cytochrome P450 2C25-like [Hemicordylus capensis]|uniref:cytochrome P450 2C25-like n=1 Tax=Hemicordylus capensis TaxID=884348 RepID=UPI002303D380|nr:cytochrome P450 2C25-like [Hemicordylus capensis]
MLGLSELFCTVIFCLLILQFLKLKWMSRQFPPGPTPFPLIGNLWCLDLKMNQGTFTKIAKDYGRIFTMWVGHKPMIILNGFHAVKEGLITHSEELAGRPDTPFVADTMKGKGVLFATGHNWKQQRRFSLMTLRNLGMGKKSLEHRVQQEAEHLVEFFVNEKGKPMDPSFAIFHSVSNVISATVFGHRFSYDDEDFEEMLKAVDFMFHFLPSPFRIAYDLSPRLMRYLPGPHQKAFSCLKKGHELVKEEIRSHEKTRNPQDPQDFIDYYLDQIEKCKDDSNTTFDEENLCHLIVDFFAAGSETTSVTLLWALLYMIDNPDIQEKLQKELHTVLGPTHKICYADRNRVPYTNAVIHEVQRFCNFLLVGSFRECMRDITLQGFHIKKGTVVIPDVGSVLYDPEQWETPQKFNPNHFLDEDGNFYCREAFIPFAAGHRVCLGERLARTELFIFFTNLLRTFKLQLPEGVKTINTEPVIGGLAMVPHPYKVCAVPY